MTLQKIIPVVLLVSLTFSAGLLVNRAAMVETIKHVGVLLRALVANFIVVPLLAVLVTRAYHLSEPIAIGLLLMAMAPGVPFILLAGGRKKGGSLEFAVELTFTLAAISTLTIPFTARLLLPEGNSTAIPLSQLTALVLFQLLPLLLGTLLARWKPGWAQRITPFFKRLTLIGLIALFAMITPQIVRSFAILFGSFGVLAMLTLTLLSLATGWAAGGRDASYRHTLAIGTLLRNPASAAVIATTFKSPVVDAVVVTYLVVQFAVANVAGKFFKRVMDE